MADRGHELTDDILEDLEKRLKEEYETAAREMAEKYRKYMEKYTREEAVQRALRDAGKITEKDYRDWVYRHTMMGKRWADMRDVLAADMHRTNEIARAMAEGRMPDVLALNANYGTYMIEHGGRIDTGFTLYDPDTVQYIVEEHQLMPGPSTKKAKEIAANKDMQWNARKIQSAVLQGILQGESAYEIAERLTGVAQMNYNAAVRYARTMTTNAENAGRYASFYRAKDLGVKLTIEWSATLDGRTRHEHRMMHGQRREVGEPFVVDGIKIMWPAQSSGEGAEEIPQQMIWNCRCTLLSWVKGFEGDTVKSSPKMGKMTFEEWQHAKEPKKKESVVPTYKLFKNGEEAKAFFGERPDRKLRRENREEYDRKLEQYYESQYGKWRKTLSDEQIDALGNYSAEYYSGMNGLCRGQMTERMAAMWSDVKGKSLKDLISNAEEAISAFELREPITVFRTIESRVLDRLHLEAGSVFRDNAFVSTSVLSEKVASGNVVMRINVPAGKGVGAWINPLSAYEDSEWEFLLQRGSMFRVKSIEKIGEDTVVDLDLIGISADKVEYATKEHVVKIWKEKGIYDEKNAAKI